MTESAAREAERAVVADDGEAITLVSYRGAERMAVVELDPLRAVALAGELATAAARHLARSQSATKTRRGGDRHRDRRAARDAALRSLAELVGEGMPAGRQARTLAERLARYRPAPSEVSAERRLMREVVETGLPVPGVDRLKRILKTG